MKLNALPLLFLPGVVLVGALLGGWPGTETALLCWLGVVLTGTTFNLVHHVVDGWTGVARSRRAAMAEKFVG